MMQNFSILKIIGWIGTFLILGLFFGSSILGLAGAIREGSWSGVLEHTGGKLFSLDKLLSEETDFLLEETSKPTEEKDSYAVIFHISYGISILLIYITLFFLLFRLGSWVLGLRQFEPTTDVVLFIVIFGMFFVVEYLYTMIFLKTSIIPLWGGVIRFIINLPAILQNLL